MEVFPTIWKTESNNKDSLWSIFLSPFTTRNILYENNDKVTRIRTQIIFDVLRIRGISVASVGDNVKLTCPKEGKLFTERRAADKNT